MAIRSDALKLVKGRSSIMVCHLPKCSEIHKVREGGGKEKKKRRKERGKKETKRGREERRKAGREGGRRKKKGGKRRKQGRQMKNCLAHPTFIVGFLCKPSSLSQCHCIQAHLIAQSDQSACELLTLKQSVYTSPKSVSTSPSSWHCSWADGLCEPTWALPGSGPSFLFPATLTLASVTWEPQHQLRRPLWHN